MKPFASILQTSLSQFTTSLEQLLINQTIKSPREEDQQVIGKSRKRTKTYVEHPEDEHTCSKYVGRFISSSGQHESVDEDNTITRAYTASENDEDDPLPDQDQVCHDVAELLQPEQTGNYKVDQQQDAFLGDICQNFKGKQEERIPLINNKLV